MSSDPLGGPLLLQLLFILLSGFLSAMQAAVTSLNDGKLRHEVEDGDDSAANLLKLADEPEKYLGTVQVCLTLVALFSSAFAALHFAPRLAQTFSQWGMTMEAGSLQTLCVVILTLVLAFITLVLGGYVPRKIALQHPEKAARLTCGVLTVLEKVFHPLVWLIHKTTNGVLRLIGIDPNAKPEEVTEEEIRMLVDMGGESGTIEEAEKEMIENIFEFNNHSAEDVMTHRTDVTSIWVEETPENVIKTIVESGLSRFPVYDEDMDDIIGVLSTRNYLLEQRKPSPRPLREIIRPAYFVPETVQADVLFRDMQKKKVHMAVVVDEYGGMSGVVTMEDLLEEIVGNIYDEFDPQVMADITRLGENLWRITGTAGLEDVAEALEIELPQNEDYDTLGGLVFSQFTTIPMDGSQPEVDVDGLHIKVEKMEEHRVETALVSKIMKPEPDEDASDTEA